MNAPKSVLLTEDNMSLFVDYYQLTMGQADFEAQNDTVITANYYVRSIPQGQYLIVAGLEQVIHYILNLHFTDATLAPRQICTRRRTRFWIGSAQRWLFSCGNSWSYTKSCISIIIQQVIFHYKKTVDVIHASFPSL